MGRRVPPKLTVREIADATGWPIRRTRGVLRRAGILEKDGRTDIVRRSRLQERESDIFDDVLEHFEALAPHVDAPR